LKSLINYFKEGFIGLPRELKPKKKQKYTKKTRFVPCKKSKNSPQNEKIHLGQNLGDLGSFGVNSCFLWGYF
jgi:hypothetical protein